MTIIHLELLLKVYILVGFKARGMVGVQVHGGTPHVKKISITSKAPPSIPY
jgi:hypothetical protein